MLATAAIDVENNVRDSCVIIAIAKAHSNGSTSIIYSRKLENDLDGEGHPFRLANMNFKYIWDNEEITLKKLKFGSIVEYSQVRDVFLYRGNTKLSRQNVDKIQMDLDYHDGAFKGIKDAFPDAKIAASLKGIYQEDRPPDRRICLIAMKCGYIENERICFITKLGELVNLKLNCRENLVLSTSPVVLQVRRVADDEVGDVAVVRMGDSECGVRNPTYQGVCEGLILKLKPKVISIDEEPVKIIVDGNIIRFPGTVKFDTGNDFATAISNELVDSLGLEPDHSKKVKVSLPGGGVLQCSRDINMVLSKLQFGNGVAYRGIADAFPDENIKFCPNCTALISVKSAKMLDGRVFFKTREDEECNLKNNCRNYMQSTIDEVALPVQVPLSLNDVGSVVLVSFRKPAGRGLFLHTMRKLPAVCEGILISSGKPFYSQTPGLQTYEMSSNPRGKCIIINNSNFQHEANNRHGAEFDEPALEDLFGRELSFHVNVVPNCTGSQMRDVAIDVAAQDHSAFDAFVFIIMSHGGDRDKIYGVDGRSVRIEELMSEFIATKCPTLQNKPKLFIFQSCRGSSTESMVPPNCHIDSVPEFSADSTLARGTCPQEADFLLAFSAAPGYYSYRNPKFGSVFIQVLVNVLRTHHHDSHLSELLQEVTRQVAETGTAQAVQVPAYSNTLRAKLYL
ncbi:hypothetical protein OS493_006258 [Desmophyllum pertusum]|uniref:Caspase-8 n=1 Tax=Desmophyllum pertusum TaxID=174260 RepID=A0A9X0A5Q4_9CNID|nr:hypothetical protein OS493_006258 [Desmophyllum pertusum]